MNLPKIDALDLTGVRVDVADAGHALDIRIWHPPGTIAGAWIFWFADESWEDNLPAIHGDTRQPSPEWTKPFAERVLEAYWRGEDVDTRPRIGEVAEAGL